MQHAEPHHPTGVPRPQRASALAATKRVTEFAAQQQLLSKVCDVNKLSCSVWNIPSVFLYHATAFIEVDC